MTASESRVSPVRRAVALLRWPEHEAERWRLVGLGAPRVLVVADGSSPPDRVDDRERHVRQGSDADVVLDAIASLRVIEPRTAGEVPFLDDDGLLWFGGRWVAVTATQIPVVQLLLANADRVTRHADVLAAYRSAGGSGNPSSLKSLLHRIGRRFAAVGLELRVVRTRGVMVCLP